jgi:nucleoside-triphosphatase
VGKTTVARRLAERLESAGIAVRGFATEELRKSGRRVGFAVETFAGEQAVLAHVDLPGPPRVSKYGVDVEALERVALPALADVGDGDVAVIDELAKMELASEGFCEAVSALFARPVHVVATVHVARHAFTDALKSRPDVETVAVTRANQDELPETLAARLVPAR